MIMREIAENFIVGEVHQISDIYLQISQMHSTH